MKKRHFYIVIAIIVCLSVLLFIGFHQSTKGIPHGVYFQLDDQGNKINNGSEGARIIQRNEAEHRYLIFSIVEIDGEIYFEIERILSEGTSDDESGIFRYEVKYDKKEKILTVTMPVSYRQPHVGPARGLEMKEFRFEKTGITFYNISIVN